MGGGGSKIVDVITNPVAPIQDVVEEISKTDINVLKEPNLNYLANQVTGTTSRLPVGGFTNLSPLNLTSSALSAGTDYNAYASLFSIPGLDDIPGLGNIGLPSIPGIPGLGGGSGLPGFGDLVNPLKSIADAIEGIGGGVFGEAEDLFSFIIKIIKYAIKFLDILFKMLEKAVDLFDVLFYLAPAMIDLYFIASFLSKMNRVDIKGIDSDTKSIINTVIITLDLFALYMFYTSFGWNDFKPSKLF